MPYLPTPWMIGSKMFEWKADRHLDLPLPQDIRILHGGETVDKHPRMEIPPRLAMMNRRVWGYVVDITAPTDANFCEIGKRV